MTLAQKGTVGYHMDIVSQDIKDAGGANFVGRSIVTNHRQMLARMLHMNGRDVCVELGQ